MEYIHVRNLEKYHPGYKDRTLQWAKIYINMASGDPDTELIENEIDWARLVKIILLELRAQKPLPNSDRFFEMKGFNLKDRPMSLTIQMLHNFLDIVTEMGETVTKPLRRVDKIRVREDKEEDSRFLELWNQYPKRDGRKEAYRHFKNSVNSEEDWTLIQTALKNYLASGVVAKGYVKNGSTWFNNWRDWIEPPQDLTPVVYGKTKDGKVITDKQVAHILGMI